ncbi:alkaline phosphatase [Pigmentiphaga aceris]|uniref:Alkaline phosphatase n=1 Tax=Pigmentiphaga aceris TaxID=1940612 RepID=A0A5C0B016_9BURK|nr:alkaline phosphatase D family protein [Pigmentiphaga aceris]QEI08069.1 alkaline phosphatase [Pigmentiphaga aceris]
MHRRELLRLAAAAATATSLPRWSWSATLTQRALFPLGVASGSPAPDGVVLWTRLLDGPVPGTVPADTPRVSLPDSVTVRWEVAEDENFRRIVRQGEANALAALGHAVHVDVTGLKPDSWYCYRFMHGDAVTPTARTRTAPAPDAMPEKIRFAFASCQRWEHGHYAAYRHMQHEDLDLVLFLGDYIYEYAMPKTQPGQALARTHSLAAAKTLDDYRDRYALYRTDEHLQAAHCACPWIVTWDDHEVQDDYAGLSGVGDAQAFLARRNAAYQAFYENMPLRASVLRHGLQGLGTPDAVQVHARHDWGRLLRFHVLDTRQYRNPQACRTPGEKPQGAVSPAQCPALIDPARSMLGTEQEDWLMQGLAQDAGTDTRWSVLAQQTIFSQRNYRLAPEESYSGDTWDGYPASRQRLLNAISSTRPRNTVFVGGDIHQNYVCRVLADFAAPQSPVIASEFCGTSISSRSNATQHRTQKIIDDNPHVLFARPDKRGYAIVDVTPKQWTTTLRVVDDVMRADSGVSTLARFVVNDGVPGPRAV